MKIKGKTIILTGAARIGKSVARALGGRGANLVITYKDSPKEAEFIREERELAGVKTLAVQADLSRSEDIENLIKKTKQEFGSLDVLIHMAAIYPRTPWKTLKENDWNKTMDIIAKSAFLLGKMAGDELLKNAGEEIIAEGKKIGRIKGKIITISDWSVLTRPFNDYLPYNAAKAAVIGITKSLAKELAPDILVNSIAPGPILAPPDLTPEENAEVIKETPLKRWGGPEEIVKAVLYLLEADFVTGHILTVDGGRTIS